MQCFKQCYSKWTLLFIISKCEVYSVVLNCRVLKACASCTLLMKSWYIITKINEKINSVCFINKILLEDWFVSYREVYVYR